jgi:hypothetical protein
MGITTFNNVWYLPSENIWQNFNTLAFRDSGRLIIHENSLEFNGNKGQVMITDIRRVTIGLQGRDFINNWVKVEYGADGKAYFADGSLLGWGGVFGGTINIYNQLVRFNPRPSA